jgi:4-hydroxy 2-oxovalerate aldolase
MIKKTIKMKTPEILDCTLRDGGYYTNWDFDSALVSKYMNTMQELPVDIIEIGYRSTPQKEYLGRYFYLPDFALEKITQLNIGKKLSVMFNVKNTETDDLPELLKGLQGKISLIRLAVNPEDFNKSVILAKEIKKRGFEVACNIMYMSKYYHDSEFLSRLEILNDVAAYVNLVDSYGGMTPGSVAEMITRTKGYCNCKIGFHGHDNMELAFANSLAAIEAGCDIVDSTILGMGRGAGNLKTELLLTYLVAGKQLDFDFNALASLVETWTPLHNTHQWGTNLPYMVSGANSLPQNDVMEWVTQRFYSFNSIIRALHNQKSGDPDNIQLPVFSPEKKFRNVIIIGGGPGAQFHADAIRRFTQQNEDVCLVHASSKNARSYENLSNEQFFCLVGSEGKRMEDVFNDLTQFSGQCILPPFPRKMGTYLPEKVQNVSFELKSVDFTDKFNDSHTALALQTAIELGAEKVFLAGYDGYSNESITPREQALLYENDYLFGLFMKHKKLCSILPTNYAVETISVYSLLH